MLLPRSLAATVDNVARQAIGKEWNLYAALLNHWREIVGEEYAQVTTPVKISFPQGKKADEKWAQGQRTDGILHIRLPQGLTMEFSFRTDQIRQRIASFFGYNVIARIAFEPYYKSENSSRESYATEPGLTPAETAPPLQDIQNVSDEELRASLEGLGKAIFRTNKGA
jgi:hypothetical protein